MKKFGMAIALGSLLAFALLFGFQHATVLVVRAAGAPDAYGNQIANCTVSQLDGAWVVKGVVTSSNYTSGVQIKVDANKNTMFNVTLKLNNTFASNTDEAMSNTRCYINITYTNGTVVVATTEMTDWEAVNGGDGFYYVYTTYTWTASGYPEAGVTYNVYLKYEAYY